MTAPLPRISVSVKAAVLHEGHILLLSYEDHSGFHYNLPGGKAREGEGLRQAVYRKVLQETGLDVVVDRLLLVTEYVPAAWDYEFGTVQKTPSWLGPEAARSRGSPSRGTRSRSASNGRRW
jgi:8-oxo-dGTP diphosphatase